MSEQRNQPTNAPSGARPLGGQPQPNRPVGRGPGGPGRGPGGGPMRGLLPGEKAKDFSGTMKRLLRYISPYAITLIGVMLLTITSTALRTVSPKVIGEATDSIYNSLTNTGHVDYAALQAILTALLLIYVVSSFLSLLQGFLMSNLSQKIVRTLRNDIDAKLTRLPLSYFDGHTHGEILSRVINDVDTISSSLQQSLNQIISSVVSVVSILLMMLSISIPMTIVTLLTVPFSVIITTRIAKYSQPLFAAQQRTLGELNGHVEEMYSGHLVVKAYGREQANIVRFREINGELFQHGWKAQFISGIIQGMINFVGNIGYVAVCIAGGIFTAQGTMSIGRIQSFLQYSRQFNQPLNQTAQIVNIMQSTIAAAERVFELLNETEMTADDAEALELPAVEGHVRFSGVRFGYDEKPVIHNLNFNIEAGQMIAIVGPTGAGKTTLVNLLMRFYEIQQGSISIDDMDVRKIKRADLRTVFGMVLQDAWLYNDTIANNIRYGKLGASDEEIVEAAKAASADHFIRTLPEGYNTVLNEEASNISQGQKQLLTIARALLSNPRILILDEATSSVDTRTEQLIQQAMATLMQGRTSFVIAHRLSTIRDADLILVMKDGDIIEQGNHLDLLEANGFYADLYNSQFTTAGGTVDEAMGLPPAATSLADIS